MRLASTLVFTFAGALATLGAGACGTYEPVGTYTRDSDSPLIDQPAMSTGLDKRDLDRMFGALVNDLVRSPFYAGRAGSAPTPSIALMPLANETTEHIEVQLDALGSKVETALVRGGGFDVVSRERQADVLAEIDNQQAAAFDPARAARVGRMVGAEYVVVGKVFDAAERTLDMRRVQYMAFLQVIEVDTGLVKWQAETDVTKAYVADIASW
ncbi:MAG: penicillin-binding protein activator LpoB [Myxococcales bacterium]|nr:penicillin-binding protein activator LpoB [Myxococcales bacterium]MCB9733014.1 penicillin-binding protein activator LpoB [Deltaproteobacteria bacterium]